jgi:hypothetical protein
MCRREARSRERAGRWRCWLMVTCIWHACSWCRRWVQMVVMVQEITPWPGYVPTTCGSTRGSESITSCCSCGTSCQARTYRTWSSSSSVHETRVDTCGTGEGLMVVPGHHVTVSTTRWVDTTAGYQLVLGVPAAMIRNIISCKALFRASHKSNCGAFAFLGCYVQVGSWLRGFGTAYRSDKDPWRWVTNYQCCINIPEERRPQLHCSRSLE